MHRIEHEELFKRMHNEFSSPQTEPQLRLTHLDSHLRKPFCEGEPTKGKQGGGNEWMGPEAELRR